MLRLSAGLLKPKKTILGSDIAGRVEAVGRNVKEFQPGDEVFGDISGCGFGGFAEYVSVPENVVVLKPASMTFEQAAAVPMAAVTALQGRRMGVGNAVLFRAHDFDAPPPIALEAMQQSDAGTS